MNISKTNCEAFFLDYYEGNLSEAQVAEMFAFLKANPDQREVFESFSNVQLDGEDDATSSPVPHSPPDSYRDRVPDFSFLKKETEVDVHEAAEQWMVDAVDGTITDENKTALEKYLTEFPEKKNDLAAFEKTILRADETESLNDTGFLKKENAVTKNNFEDYAIAMVEGTISEKEKSLLETFVLAHPEFRVQLDAFRASKLKADESVVFEAKSSLKKTSVAVTIDNIDELLIAKSEGQLASHEEQAVDVFVAKHPEYKKDLELLAKTKLVADPSEVFELKNKLKKGSILITEENFEQYLISASEGLLNREELKVFNAFVATHPKYRNALALFAATRLQPDMSIVYEDKEGLKRKEKGGAIWWSVNIRYAAAAVVVIVLGIYLWMKFATGNPNETPFVNNGEYNVNPDHEVVPFDENNQVQIKPKEDLVADNGPGDSSPKVDWSIDRSNYGNYNIVKKDAVENPSPLVRETYNPKRIVAQSVPNKANDAVDFSDALYSVVYDQPAPVAEEPKDDYISPGQLAMRWMKDKIEGTDPVPVQQDEPVAGFGENQPKDKNVDGLDLTETAVNRVGQSTANGNISMEQRADGTYLNLWNYEVRVSK